MTDWDAGYSGREDFYGAAYPDLVEWIAGLPGRGRALDVGCGQGRNALELARLGFSVVAIDPSPVGIAQLSARAGAQGLAVAASVDTVETFEVDEPFALILVDMVLHGLGNELDPSALVARLAAVLAPGGVLVVVTPGPDEDAERVRHLPGSTLVVDRPIVHRFDGETLTFHLTVVEMAAEG